MPLAEILREVCGLPREDKLTLLRQLSDELTAEDLIPPGMYEVWSPTEDYAAAKIMYDMLYPERETP